MQHARRLTQRCFPVLLVCGIAACSSLEALRDGMRDRVAFRTYSGPPLPYSKIARLHVGNPDSAVMVDGRPALYPRGGQSVVEMLPGRHRIEWSFKCRHGTHSGSGVLACKAGCRYSICCGHVIGRLVEKLKVGEATVHTFEHLDQCTWIADRARPELCLAGYRLPAMDKCKTVAVGPLIVWPDGERCAIPDVSGLGDWAAFYKPPDQSDHYDKDWHYVRPDADERPPFPPGGSKLTP